MTIVGPNPVTMAISIFGIIITYIIYIECKKKWENTIVFPFAIICMIFSGLLLIGFIGYPFPKGGGEYPTPVGVIESINITSSSNVTITFGTIASSEKLQTNFQFLLCDEERNDVYSHVYAIFSFPPCDNYSIEMISSLSNTSAIFTNGDSSNNLGPGDYINISGLTPGKTYEFKVVWMTTHEIIQITGDNSFTMPNY
jgi:hypothetical protein